MNEYTHNKSHLAVHNVTKGFSEESDLTKHERVRTREKKFSCSQCDKRFSRNNSRNKHERIHTIETIQLLTMKQEFYAKNNRNKQERTNIHCSPPIGIMMKSLLNGNHTCNILN